MLVHLEPSVLGGLGLTSVFDLPAKCVVHRQRHRLVSKKEFMRMEAAGIVSEFHGINSPHGVILLGTPQRPTLDYHFNSSNDYNYNVKPYCVRHDDDTAVLEWRTQVPVARGQELLWKYEWRLSAEVVQLY